ncbi:GMC family oxidoreductase [Streptomyces sp. 4503]|uniref:GMC family oxidoreductase n=1 Tax=Streptomyces niphimycinicus TaxID=2842201 RepID=A0ABS6CB01_9ACTN|nr:GMC family oxidoreductase [Streptomyces niphimycinicus]MBU3864072.1 GMC family oxidoreductase [Streptomyces niphimycinicus]
MTERAVVVGSGPGGSVAAMVLAEAGWDVTVLERGPNHFEDLRDPAPRHVFSPDEIKGPVRGFEYPDPLAEPRVFHDRGFPGPPHTGFVNALPAAVGGGSVHWDAKTPRLWDLDFAKRSMLGPLPDCSVVDWPFDYAELAPYYTEMEALLGVQGDRAALPAVPTLRHAPRDGDFPMPPGPDQESSVRAARAARELGLRPYPMPMAANSRPYDSRPACTDCGACCGYGCPNQSRGSALPALRRAVLAGAEVLPLATAVSVRHSGRRASGVVYADAGGHRVELPADRVVLAGSAVESCRLALLSELPDPSGLLGRHLMFHWYSVAYGLFLSERVRNARGRNITHALDDFADPDHPGAREAAREAGLPYLRGGVVELGGGQPGPVEEGRIYRRLLPKLAGAPYGPAFQRLMRESPLRDRLLGVQMHGEDVSQRENRIDLESGTRDWLGVPVPHITWAPHRHETTAQRFYLPRLAALLRAAGADEVAAVPETRSRAFPGEPGTVPGNFHTLGGMRMSADPGAGVTDGVGRMHSLDNVFVADGGLFPTSGAHNPTLTIMATALRNTRRTT